VLCLLICAPAFFSQRTEAASTSIRGALEGIDQNGVAFGWAQDVTAPAVSIQVHLYVDGPAGGGGTFIAAAAADVPRTEPIPGAHGFRVTIPPQFWDGRPHTLYAYGIAGSGTTGGNAVLPASPQSFLLNSTIVRMDNGVIQFAVETRCGGTLVQFGLRGRNVVNNGDCTGRQIQTALYDGNAAYDSCAGCKGVWGWDPVQGGDVHNFGSPVLARRVTAESVYVATRPNEWYPDNKGGGRGRPVPSDVVIEQTVSFVPNYLYGIRVHYRITHLGSDTHTAAVQEFPAVWVNRAYDRFISYAGAHPWTGDAVSVHPLNAIGEPATQRRVSEHWAALVDAEGVGVTVYVPQQYPYAIGMRLDGTDGEFGFGANYFRPHVPLMFGPGSVFEGEFYLIAGDYRKARRDLQTLHDAGVRWADILPPFGSLDVPSAHQAVSGTVPVAGWVFDNTEVAHVEILLDGKPVGTASYGLSRPDVATVYPHAPAHVGFAYPFDTSRHPEGPHQLAIRATDRSGNVAVLPAVPIVIHRD
jgi:hypothetical protein